ADIDDGGDELALRRFVENGQHQLPVDLEPPRMQLLQRHDRGIAGAEVIDLDIDAPFLDLVDIEADDAVVLVEIDGFYQLEGETAGRQSEPAQGFDQPFVMQAPERDIDRSARHPQAHAVPAGKIGQGLVE